MSVVSDLLKDLSALHFTFGIGPANIQTRYRHPYLKIHHITVSNEEARHKAILELQANTRWWGTTQSHIDGLEYHEVDAQRTTDAQWAELRATHPDRF
jgi:hypothetical protein